MNDNKKTILITGGAGFIGSHLCKKYLDEGHRIICVDNLQTTFTPKNIECFLKNKNFTFIKQDIIKPLKIKEKIDWIFNLACAGSYTSYQFDPVHTTKTNTIGMILMLELARAKGARLLQTSTSEIYGDPLESPQKETYRGNVNTLGPRACYDEGKRCAETLCMDYYREDGVDVKIVRIFNTYGPNMDPNDGRVITNFVLNALSGRNLEIYGDGMNTRSFQYIDDLVEGLDRMMKKDDFTGPVNMGNPGEFTVQELAEKVIKMTESSSKIIYTNAATDDPKRRCPDITLAKNELDWEPKISLDKGLKRAIEYFKTVKRADSKVLVFATTYYPIMGPAERALMELSRAMPDVEFHIVTTKFKKGVTPLEQVGDDLVYRIGAGSRMDKYLLPFLGVLKARRLNKENEYRFVWSIMASYGALSAIFMKMFDKDLNFLLSIDDTEVEKKKTFKSKILTPLYKRIFKRADSVYISDNVVEKKSAILKDIPNIAVQGGDTKSFVNKVRFTYADLINKQERKLPRVK